MEGGIKKQKNKPHKPLQVAQSIEAFCWSDWEVQAKE